MNRLYISHVLQSVIVIFIQVLLLKNVQVPIMDRYTLAIFIYPMVILFFPLEMRRSFVILLAFIIGLLIDLFYDTLGIHAAALTLTGFIRTPILQLIEPRQGYRNTTSLSIRNYGLNWIAGYTSIMLGIHILVFYSIDAFSPVYILKVLVNSLITFVASFVVILLYKTLATGG